MSDSGKILSKRKVSMYVGKKAVGSEIIKKKGTKYMCYVVVKGVQVRRCKKGEIHSKMVSRARKGKSL